jgi:hypothetical protein
MSEPQKQRRGESLERDPRELTRGEAEAVEGDLLPAAEPGEPQQRARTTPSGGVFPVSLA